MAFSTPTTLLAVTLGLAGTALGDQTATLSPTSNFGTWDGWGTSLAWWANKWGDRDDLADLFFTLKNTTINGLTMPGLGMNVARYNVGACSKNKVNGQSMVVSNIILPHRQIDAFWLDPASSDPASSSWDWTRDAKQRAMVAKAQARGVNIIELFSNSPVWWMTNNRNPSGAPGGGENLPSSNYQKHAIYMATVAKYAKDHWNLTFASVEPFNEPISNFWNNNGKQEGCHFGQSAQNAIIPLLRTELDSRSLSSMPIAASDETNYGLAIQTFNNYGAAVQAKVGRINAHGYGGNNNERQRLRDLAFGKGKGLWNSEYGESDGSGVSLARYLLADLRILRPTAWSYWQVIDHDGWAALDADNEASILKKPTPKFYALAHFMRHIRAGMRMLDAGGEFAAAAYDAKAGKLVLVAANFGDATTFKFDLSKLGTKPAAGATVARWTSVLQEGGEKYVRKDTVISGAGTTFSASFGKNSIQSFEITGVAL